MKYKVGDRVRIKSLDWYNENKDNLSFYTDSMALCFANEIVTIKSYGRYPNTYRIDEDEGDFLWTDEMIEGLVEEETKPKDMGEISDGYHTFNELYEYRMLYNAALFNEFAKQGLYDVHKSRKHSDGEYPFGDSNWFIVMAELPTGQISNHYEMKDWDKFQIPEKPLANKWDEHSPKDVADRLTSFTTPKKEYPKTYAECYKIMGVKLSDCYIQGYKSPLLEDLQELLICRDAYWKIAGEEMGLGRPWKPDWNIYEHKFCLGTDKDKVIEECVTTGNRILAFPIAEMRDAFYENFKEEIKECKELL